MTPSSSTRALNPATEAEHESAKHEVPADTVFHDAFGTGKVVSVGSSGERAEAVVDFADVGKKHLILRYAPLKKVDKPH